MEIFYKYNRKDLKLVARLRLLKRKISQKEIIEYIDNQILKIAQVSIPMILVRR